MDAIIFLVILSVLLFVYYEKNREKYKLISMLRGPKGLPLFGIALELLSVKPIKLLDFIEEKIKKHGRVFSFMIGPQHFVLFTDPSDVEVILSSQKLLDKSAEYEFFSDWLGTGLLTSSGKKWHLRRKAITPAFHFKILDQFVEIFERHSSVFVQKLKEINENQPVEIFQPIGMCALDIICGNCAILKVLKNLKIS